MPTEQELVDKLDQIIQEKDARMKSGHYERVAQLRDDHIKYSRELEELRNQKKEK